MIINDLFEAPQLCPECGGISFSDLILAEKKDACYYKVKASAKVWPSAYASGRLVQCRKKGAGNYGNKSEGRLNEFAPGGNSASSYYAVTSNFVNEFAQRKQEELQDLIDAGWTKQDLAQSGQEQGDAADIAHFEQVRDGFLKGLKPGFDAYLQGDTQLKDQLGAYWIDNDLPLNQDWEKIYGEPWGDDGEFNEGMAEGKINEFAPPGGDDRGPGDEEILRRLAAQWWSGTEQQMIKAQQTLEALGWEIGPDESGDDDAGVYVYRIGDNDGRDTLAFGHNELSLDEGMAEGKRKKKSSRSQGYFFPGYAYYGSGESGEGGGDGGGESKNHSVAEGWKEDSDAHNEFLDSAREQLQSANPAERMALAVRLSNLEKKHFGDEVGQGFDNTGISRPRSGLSAGIQSILQSVVNTKPSNVQDVGFGTVSNHNVLSAVRNNPDYDGDKIPTSTRPITSISQSDYEDDDSYPTADEMFSQIIAQYKTTSPERKEQLHNMLSQKFDMSIEDAREYMQYMIQNGAIEPEEWKQMQGDNLGENFAQPTGAVDAKGRTQQQWIQAVTAKFPGAQIIQSKMIDGPVQARVDGKTFVWNKVEQGVDEARTSSASFRQGNNQRAATNAMSPEERRAHEEKRAEQQRKRDDARLERERQRNAAKKGVAEDQVNEKSTSQAQFRTMAAAAHNPKFARKVGISQDVAREFNKADKGQDYKDLPKKADESKNKPAEKEADYGDDYQDMVARVKKLAGLGPLKTVYDPQKRVYRNMPTAVQPKK